MKQNKKQGEISHLLEWQEINNTIQNNLPPHKTPQNMTIPMLAKMWANGIVDGNINGAKHFAKESGSS
jgi:hypothetical protein